MAYKKECIHPLTRVVLTEKHKMNLATEIASIFD